MKRETTADPTQALAYDFTLNGWHDSRRCIPITAQRYWDQHDEPSTDHWIPMKGPRIVIPISQWEQTLHNLHTGHHEIQAMPHTARNTVYWPGIYVEIEDFTHRCPACLAIKPHNKWEPLLPHAIPDGPWLLISTDFFEFDGKKYLLIIDYFRKNPFISKMRSTAAETTINKFKDIFAIEGTTKTLITDNGLPFKSGDFAQFCQQWNLQHITGTPNYPQSDGQAEWTVQIVKQKMASYKQDGQDWKQVLLQLRATPLIRNYPAPLNAYMADHTEKLMVRHQNNPQTLQVSKTNYKQSKINMQNNTTKGTESHPSKNVLIQHNEENLEPATVLQIGLKPRCYFCTTTTDKVFCRNKKHIQNTGKPDTPQQALQPCLKQGPQP